MVCFENRSFLFLENFMKSSIMIYYFIQSINKHSLLRYFLQSNVLDLMNKKMNEERWQHLLSAHCKPDTVVATFKYSIPLCHIYYIAIHIIYICRIYYITSWLQILLYTYAKGIFTKQKYVCEIPSLKTFNHFPLLLIQVRLNTA